MKRMRYQVSSARPASIAEKVTLLVAAVLSFIFNTDRYSVSAFAAACFHADETISSSSLASRNLPISSANRLHPTPFRDSR